MYIHLQPGEAFEHVHAEESTTMLVEGEMVLEINGRRAALITGLPTYVDAKAPHRLVNTGTIAAVAKCIHAGIKITP